jgi:hypothetical protein
MKTPHQILREKPWRRPPFQKGLFGPGRRESFIKLFKNLKMLLKWDSKIDAGQVDPRAGGNIFV